MSVLALDEELSTRYYPSDEDSAVGASVGASIGASVGASVGAWSAHRSAIGRRSDDEDDDRTRDPPQSSGSGSDSSDTDSNPTNLMTTLRSLRVSVSCRSSGRKQ